MYRVRKKLNGKYIVQEKFMWILWLDLSSYYGEKVEFDNFEDAYNLINELEGK